VITEQILKNLCPYAKPNILKDIVNNFNELAPAPQFDVTTDLRVCHFFAQAAVETDWFKTLQEYASGDQYENRKDLGNTQPGDGRRYKGRGIFQTTGRYNYDAAGKKMGLDLINNPQLLLEPRNAVLSALYYWQGRNMNAIADRDNIDEASRAVNGGYNGYEHRVQALNILKSTIGQTFIGPSSPAADVEKVQIMLKLLGYKVIAVDGLYGPATTAAVKKFQLDNDLLQTGVADEATLKLLEKKINGKKP